MFAVFSISACGTGDELEAYYSGAVNSTGTIAGIPVSGANQFTMTLYQVNSAVYWNRAVSHPGLGGTINGTEAQRGSLTAAFHTTHSESFTGTFLLNGANLSGALTGNNKSATISLNQTR